MTAPRGGRNHTPVPAPSSPTARLHTKSIYDPPAADDGRRVLVTRYWPRGVPKAAVDEYVSALAPSRALLRAFKAGAMDWDAFRDRYLEEMKAAEPQTEVRRLAALASTRPVTLMCVCKEEARCHRSLLKEFVLARRDARSSRSAAALPK